MKKSFEDVQIFNNKSVPAAWCRNVFFEKKELKIRFKIASNRIVRVFKLKISIWNINNLSRSEKLTREINSFDRCNRHERGLER